LNPNSNDRGQLSEAISKTAAAPLERTKLILQNQDELLRQRRIQRPFTGMVDCLTRLYKIEGVSSYWRGNGTNILRACPAQALNFSFKGLYAPLVLSL
jgi:solute carrier family 25 (adenine nucleotide translocator) protein 4/5/6/31